MELKMKEYLIGFLSIILVLYYIIKSKLNYWKKLGVKGPRPIPFFGNFTEVFLKRLSTAEKVNNIYYEWKNEPFVGFFKGFDPQLIINDLDLIKTVLIKDFNVFPGRGIHVDHSSDPLSDQLLNLEGPRWKAIRVKLSPIFTTGKLKQMVELMIDCSDHFESFLINEVGDENIIDCREAAAKFTTDVIGICAFGINMNAISRAESEFRKVGKTIFMSDFRTILSRLIREIHPRLYEFLKLRQTSKESTDFFVGSIKETIEYRKREGIIRNDLINLFMEIRANQKEGDIEFTDELMAAQAFVFFAAGFETASSTISFALYELAHVPEIQKRLREEIIETLEKCKGQLSYETLNNMKYLGMVIQETLRKNPPLFLLSRRADRDYKIPDTNVIIKKGKIINIPVYSIQRDSRYYSDPELFDPERFTDEAISQRHPMAYLPFSDGPKVCIASRFAAYQVKLGIIKTLKNFSVEPSESTEFPYKFDKGTFVLAAEGGVHLVFKPLRKNN